LSPSAPSTAKKWATLSAEPASFWRWVICWGALGAKQKPAGVAVAQAASTSRLGMR